MVVVAMVRYWWSSDGDVADVDCCYGGNCYNFFKITVAFVVLVMVVV